MTDDIKTILRQKPLRIPPDLAVFVGHFPAQPIVPGIYSIQLILEHIRQKYQKNFDLQEIVRCKFCRRLEPGLEITIEIEFLEKKGDLEKVRGKIIETKSSASITEMTILGCINS